MTSGLAPIPELRDPPQLPERDREAAGEALKWLS